jgi:hypothetical protein
MALLAENTHHTAETALATQSKTRTEDKRASGSMSVISSGLSVAVMGAKLNDVSVNLGCGLGKLLTPPEYHCTHYKMGQWSLPHWVL